MTKYWISCKWATCQVNTDDSNIIVETAPIWRKFVGQPLTNLCSWLRQTGPIKVELL